MGRSTRLRVLTYDVSSNSRRRKIARILEDSASRVQYSVFEGRLSDKAVERLVARIEPLLQKGDSLRTYTVGATGERKSNVRGSGVSIETEAGFWLL